jgi:hypothetical protein
MSDFIEDYIEAVVAIKVVVCILGNVNSLTALVCVKGYYVSFLDQFSGYCYVI